MKTRFVMDVCEDHTQQDEDKAILAKGDLFNEAHILRSEMRTIYFDSEAESFFFDLNCSHALPIGTELYGLSLFDEHQLFGDLPPIITSAIFLVDKDRVVYKIEPAQVVRQRA